MRRKPTIWEAVSCIVFMVVTIGVGFIYLDLPVQPLLIMSATYAGIMASRLGVKWSEMEQAISRNLMKAMPAIFIILSSGIVIGTWMYSGTVPMLIYYGLKIISPQMFLVISFLIVAIISLATGTAWGAAATAGVALMAMAHGLGIPIHMAAGAIVAGAVFGDKLSPLSDTTNLATLVTGVDIFAHIEHTLYTTIPAVVIAFIVYFIAGTNMETTIVSKPLIDGVLNILDSIYNWNVMLILPIIVLFIGGITRKPTVLVMLLSSVVAVFVGMFSHGFTFANGVDSMVTGFNLNMVRNIEPLLINDIYILNMINRGGIAEMTTIVVTIFCAYIFAGILEEAGCLEVILEVVYSKVKNIYQLFVITILGSIGLVLTTGVASIPILMMGSLLTDAYIRMGLHPKNLSRTLEDAGTSLVPFIPWGASGYFYTQVLGITPMEYGIWLVPCYLGVVFTIIYAASGIFIAKISHDESQKYLEQLLEKEQSKYSSYR